MEQERGIVGKLVGQMVRRTVRQRFHTVYWRPPSVPLQGPLIWACNHTGWHDGYIMLHVITRMGVVSMDWVAEFNAFPLFERIGAMPFPPDDPARRMKTIRQTLRRIEGGESLIQFADGVLRPEGQPWEVGEAIDLVVRKFPEIPIVPTAIVYRMGIHERPVCGVWIGDPQPPMPRDEIKEAIQSLEKQASDALMSDNPGEVLVEGTKDVNERFAKKK